MTRVIKSSWTWLWVTLALLVGAIANAVWTDLSFDGTIPVTFDRVEVMNSPIHTGDSVIVRIWRDKPRGDCTVKSERTAINQDGRVFDIPDAEWDGGPAGTPFLDYAYQTTFDMGPGRYVLRVHLTYECPNFTFSIEQPEAHFRIVSRGRDAPP